MKPYGRKLTVVLLWLLTLYLVPLWLYLHFYISCLNTFYNCLKKVCILRKFSWISLMKNLNQKIAMIVMFLLQPRLKEQFSVDKKPVCFICCVTCLLHVSCVLNKFNMLWFSIGDFNLQPNGSSTTQQEQK